MHDRKLVATQHLEISAMPKSQEAEKWYQDFVISSGTLYNQNEYY